MIKKVISLFLVSSSVALASNSDPYTYITIGSDAAVSAQTQVMSIKNTEFKAQDGQVQVMKVHKTMIPFLSSMMHTEFKRCGGFMVHDSLESAKVELVNATSSLAKVAPVEYTISNEAKVEKMTSELEEMGIRTTITKL